MPHRPTPVRRACLALAVIAGASSSQVRAEPAPSDPALHEARVIVRFHPGADPSDAAFRARLAASAAVQRIELVRPMSGEAWVLRMTCDDPSKPGIASAADGCDAAMRRVAASPWVAWIERDGRERHQ